MKVKYLYKWFNKPDYTISFKSLNTFVITRWYDNGNKWWEREYQNGRLHGKSIEWFKSGENCWEEEYQSGKLT